MFVPGWASESRASLIETLNHINKAALPTDEVGRLNGLFLALNKLWNSFAQARRDGGQLTAPEQSNGPSDSQAFVQLLLQGLSEKQQNEWLGRESVRRLADFTPPIMNHDILRRRQYDPSNIPVGLRHEATEEHRKVANSFLRWLADQGNPDHRESLLKKLAALLYVVRSNTAHGEKTAYGPDLAKAERDRAVAAVASPVIEDLIEELLEKPSRRLAVYGTLAPGGANYDQLSRLSGRWYEAEAQGQFAIVNGLPVYLWHEPGDAIAVHILDSDQLAACFESLDRFEGQQYHRILVPVAVQERIAICNIYERGEGR